MAHYPAGGVLNSLNPPHDAFSHVGRGEADRLFKYVRRMRYLTGGDVAGFDGRWLAVLLQGVEWRALDQARDLINIIRG